MLGAGGARGLSHIPVLEALDELGLKPALISGCSIGAIVGAAYAAGLSGRDLREHALQSFPGQGAGGREAARCARVGKLADLVRGLGNPALIDGERLLDLFWPQAVPDRFEELAIPFTAVAADYHRHVELVLGSGPLTPAVAGSLAIPGLVRPVALGGHVLIDGGAIDPLPYERLLAPGRIVVAVDVSAPPATRQRGAHSRRDQIHRRRLADPDPDAGAAHGRAAPARHPDPRRARRHWRARFLQGEGDPRAAEPVKEEVKRALSRALEQAS